MALFVSNPGRAVKRRSGLVRGIKGGKCWLCGGNVNRKERRLGHPAMPSADHVKPLCQGGTHTRKNLRLAHAYCNTVRAADEVIPDDDSKREMAGKLSEAIRRWERKVRS